MSYSNLQGVINGRITQLANNPRELKEFMSDKTEEQKRLGRKHLAQVLFMRGKK